MARTDPQINIRVPESLKEKIQNKASENNRSINAEITYILEDNLGQYDNCTSFITAEQAREIAEKAITNDRKKFLEKCMDSILERAKLGYRDVFVDIDRRSPNLDSENIIEEKIILPTIDKLKEYGYEASNTPFGILIEF